MQTKRQILITDTFWIRWILRIGVSLTFLGHGMIAFAGNVNWLIYLETVGIKGEVGLKLMSVIGIIDILIGISILIKPYRTVLIWCVFWAFATALIRPLSGESILQFIERGANWAAPLALLILETKSKSKEQ